MYCCCQAFSVETRLDVLLEQLMSIVLQHSAASRSVLLLENSGTWKVELQATIEQMYAQQPQQLQQQQSDASSSSSILSSPHLPSFSWERPHVSISDVMPQSVFSYVTHTRSTVLLSAHDLSNLSDNAFGKDVYFAEQHSLTNSDAADSVTLPRLKPKSALALPILKGGSLIGVLYLENAYHDLSVSLTSSHLQVLQLLCSQAALSIENARFTRQLQDQNARLLDEVKQRQAAEQSMRQAKETAEAAAQSKADFLSNMSHEIRTPLNAVLGMSRMLTDTELSSEQEQYVQTITTSGQLLLAIINGQHKFEQEARIIASSSLELTCDYLICLLCCFAAYVILCCQTYSTIVALRVENWISSDSRFCC